MPSKRLWFVHFTQGVIAELDKVTQLADASRTTVSYVISGKARQYRVNDKTVEKVMAVVREHNYYPNAAAAGLRAGRTRPIGLVVPDLENISYIWIVDYLKHQTRQREYQLSIVCFEGQPDNEIRCTEHLLQYQVGAIIVSTSLPPEYPSYQRWANSSLPITALNHTPDRECFTSAVGADRDDTEMLTEELHKFPAETVFCLGVLPELSVSFLHEQGFRTAWRDDPREVHFPYTNSYKRKVIAQLSDKWLGTHPMSQALFATSFALLQGVMNVTLRHDGQLPSDLAIVTFGDRELLDFLQCLVSVVAQRHRDIAERVLEIIPASLDEPREPKPGLVRIRHNLYRRGILSRD